LNEPIAHFFDTKKLNPMLEPLYQRVAKEIRKVDTHHLLFLGGAQWDSNFKVFGPPFDNKLVYTFHKYWTAPTKEVIKEYLEYSERYSVPIYMGESGENSDDWIMKFRKMLEENEVSWCFWPYKKVDSTSCVVEIARPAHYADLVGFANAPRQTFEDIRKARAAFPHARDALLEIPNAAMAEKAQINKNYVEALGMKAPTERGKTNP
jgi:endoglucanase